MSGVLRGNPDIGLGLRDLIPAGIESGTIATEHLVMAVPRDHPHAGRESVSMTDFRDEPIVSTQQTTGSVIFDRLLRPSYASADRHRPTGPSPRPQ